MKSERRFLREFRPLYVAGDPCPRGKLEMWIEMYSPHEAIEAKVRSRYFFVLLLHVVV